MKKLKILYVITQGQWGGAQRYVFDLAMNVSKNFEVTVAVGEPDGAKDLQEKIKVSSMKYEVSSSIKIIQLRHLVRPISPLHDLLAIWELRRLYKKINPNIIHLNSSKAGIIGSLANYKLSRFAQSKSRILDSEREESGQATSYKLIYTVHGWVFNEPLSPLLRQLYIWLEKITSKLKNKIIVLSPQDAAAGEKILGLTAHQFTTIPLGIAPVPTPLTAAAGRSALKAIKPSLDESKLWLGTIAGLYRTKGIDVLIRALAGLAPAQQEKIQAIIIGDGPERKNIEKIIHEHGLEQTIHLLGSLHDAARFLPAFDVFVLPSRKEGLPYTLLEARQHGLPILATSIGGIPCLISCETSGWLVPPEDREALAKKIEEIVAHPERLSPLRSAGKTAPAAPEPNTLPVMLAATAATYAELFPARSTEAA